MGPVGDRRRRWLQLHAGAVALVAGSDHVLEDRGPHALKGVGGEWRLFAVRA